MINQKHSDRQKLVWAALDEFRIELPSWGFSNTGTRFGKFLQPGAATTIAEKFADAGEVNRLTGASPTVALHVLWDLPNGVGDVPHIHALEAREGIRAGSINPNLFQSQEYKYGSIANPDAAVRAKALSHLLESVTIARELGSRDISLWVPDGSNYPGTQSIRKRIGWMQEALAEIHAALGEHQRLLIEYKPFEPAFYHTDIADWVWRSSWRVSLGLRQRFWRSRPFYMGADTARKLSQHHHHHRSAWTICGTAWFATRLPTLRRLKGEDAGRP